MELFDAVARLASLKTKTSRLKKARDGASVRTTERRFWPIALPSLAQARRSRPNITLTEKMTVIRAAEQNVPAVIRRAPVVKEVQRGVGSVVLERPELICFRYPDGDQSPWEFATPLDMAELGGDLPLVGRQELYIATLQRALGALAEIHRPSASPFGSM